VVPDTPLPPTKSGRRRMKPDKFKELSSKPSKDPEAIPKLSKEES
jgi:hypothetical protein